MTTLNATFTYTLSPVGQKASLAAGGNGKQTQTLTVPIEPADLELMNVSEDGKLSIVIKTGSTPDGFPNKTGYLSYPGNEFSWKPQIFDAPMDAAEILQWLRQREITRTTVRKTHADKLAQIAAGFLADATARAEKFDSDYIPGQASRWCSTKISGLWFGENTDTYKEALQRNRADEALAQEAKREQVRQEFLTTPDVRPGNGGSMVNNGSFQYHSVIFAANDPVTVEALRREAEAKAQRAAKEAEERAEEENRAAQKRLQLAAWVAQFGDDNQKSRFAANMLPESEVTTAIEKQAFAPAETAGLRRYERMTFADVRAECSNRCACQFDEPCRVKFETNDASSASAAEWDALETVRKVFPEAVEVRLRRHVGQCTDSDCDADSGEGICERDGIFVKLQVGALTFTREFACE